MRSKYSLAARYGLAVATIAIALGLKLLLVPMSTQETPFLLFLGAVVVSAWYGGLGPGLLATFLAVICSDYFFMTPFYRLDLADRGQWVKLLLFAAEGAFISVFGARMRVAKRRAEENARRARELEHRVIEISDQEQQRIGRDLHDGLGQHLTGIALLSRHASQRLAAKELPEAAELRQIEQLVNDAVKHTRDLASGLSPLAAETEGLSNALHELAERTGELFRVPCHFTCEGDTPNLDPSVATHLYRIAQEAVHNAIRHANASQLQLTLTTTPDRLVMIIQDNGAGMPSAGQRPAGMGLQTMKERANLIEARLVISPGPAGGTQVTCTLDSRPKTSVRGESVS